MRQRLVTSSLPPSRERLQSSRQAIPVPSATSVWICSHNTGSSAGSVLHGQTIASGVYLRDTQNLSSSCEVSLLVCLRLCFPLACLALWENTSPPLPPCSLSRPVPVRPRPPARIVTPHRPTCIAAIRATCATCPWWSTLCVSRLQVRRVRGATPTCPRQTFAERLPARAPCPAQRTERLTTALRVLGSEAGGEAGARRATRLRMPLSGDTVLRMLHSPPASTPPTPRVLGIDDFALRTGRVSGTILVALERRRPVDLLPERTAATVATWVRAHPGVEIIARDRAQDYARGATAGAPEATQVVDRFH